ncbi:efflux RND transporter periplasmic adaptor subunit [Ferruginibacter paludis]|uniref:efflux RND transporter periplasmic adaptor subunit n=1 Tax=Ferruginibacter paludis TaxID=1310417 RepID=UPI0025B590C3|nr:efflux RND transporter periplasmic adaptor subunit [Ferruginibacter paludis]MDN3656398.1 efflux RND transporter periplasmic adaptor subunit [Ferruginibacter paludis]
MYLKYLQLSAGYATLFLLTACGNSKDQAPPPPPPPAKVTVQPVIKTDAVYYDEYPATINALNQVELRPQVSGFISGVYFKDGARVRKGQLLYSIDEQLYAANYQQAVAGLSVQEANLNKAQKDANRFHELDKNDAVAKQLVDNADAALEVAKKQAEAARANIQAVQTNVKYTKVYAPFDGLIGISAVKPGAAVTAGQTVLNTVSSDRELAVDFNVDQKEIYRFTKLMSDAPKKADSTFSLAFGTDVYPYPGKIALLDRAVNAQTGTIKARLIFPNNKNLLIAGMNGTVRVKNNSATQSLLIPYKAVTEQLGEFFVYVPNDSNKVSQRKIVPGKQIGANVIVKDGLKDGESVVVEGVQNLREGAAINTSSAQPAGPTTTPAK